MFDYSNKFKRTMYIPSNQNDNNENELYLLVGVLIGIFLMLGVLTFTSYLL